MLTIVTCNGNQTLLHCQSWLIPIELLPRICLHAEQAINDGYAVTAMIDGRFVADATGYFPDRDHCDHDWDRADCDNGPGRGCTICGLIEPLEPEFAEIVA